MNLKDGFKKCYGCNRTFSAEEGKTIEKKILGQKMKVFVCLSCIEKERINNRIIGKDQRRLI